MAQTAVSAVAQLGGAGVPVGSKRKQEVLEEDEWTALLEDIVARDFFPDVPKLQSKLEWLQVCQGSSCALLLCTQRPELKPCPRRRCEREIPTCGARPRST